MGKVLAGVLFGLFIGFAPLAVLARDQATLVYGYPDVSIWTTKRDSGGQLKNPLLKLADTLFSEAGIEWQARPLPAKRLFKYLKEGVVPFTMLVRAPGLESCCLFSEHPVSSTELRVYRRHVTQAVREKEDLAGKRVITIRGYSYGGLGKYLRDPRNKVEMQEAASHAEAFLLFERGRGDYLIDYQGPAEEILREQQVVDAVYDTYKRLDVFLVLSRTFPDAPAVLKQLETVVAKLPFDGKEESE